jgi:hypothetical protein
MPKFTDVPSVGLVAKGAKTQEYPCLGRPIFPLAVICLQDCYCYPSGYAHFATQPTESHSPSELLSGNPGKPAVTARGLRLRKR